MWHACILADLLITAFFPIESPHSLKSFQQNVAEVRYQCMRGIETSFTILI